MDRLIFFNCQLCRKVFQVTGSTTGEIVLSDLIVECPHCESANLIVWPKGAQHVVTAIKTAASGS